MPEITPDLTDTARCISVHWSLPVQCVLPRTHRENWHETWHPQSGNRLRYRRTARATEELRDGAWHSLTAPAPGAVCGEPDHRAVCPVSGCGSAAAYLDTTTARAARWVQVRGAGQPARDARWFCGALCAALTVGGAEIEAQVRTQLCIEAAALAHTGPASDEDVRRALTDALSIGGGYSHLAAIGARVPGIVRRLLSAEAEADRLSAAGCTACAPPGPCATDGCGTPAEDIDGSDPALWGWICLYVGGSDTAMRWVCSPWCATAAIRGDGADLAAADQSTPAVSA